MELGRFAPNIFVTSSSNLSLTKQPNWTDRDRYHLICIPSCQHSSVLTLIVSLLQVSYDKLSNGKFLRKNIIARRPVVNLSKLGSLQFYGQNFSSKAPFSLFTNAISACRMWYQNGRLLPVIYSWLPDRSILIKWWRNWHCTFSLECCLISLSFRLWEN